MDRVYQANAIETPPSTTASSGSYPTAGNKASGQLATVPGPYWFYSITEEIRNALIAAGVTPDAAKVNQLAEALGKFLPVSGGNVTGNLTVQGKNLVRSVNGTVADVNGDVAVHPPVTSVNGEVGDVTISTISISDVYPDFSAEVTLTKPDATMRSWTATADGYICMQGFGNGTTGWCKLIIAGKTLIELASLGATAILAGVGLYCVRKGDLVQYQSFASVETAYPRFIKFYPCKGA